MKKASSPSQPTTVSTFTKQERDDQLAFLYRDDLNNMAKYVTRGRKFGPLSDEELSARYVAVFRNIADNPVDWDSRAIQKDLDAEFQLRNKKIPFDLIKADFDRMSDKLTRHLDTMKSEDPDRWIEMNAEINRDFQQFLAERKNAN
jgi:hypothetical protein